jgi:hypothetical protein
MTVFTKNMGSMEVLPVLGKHLNVRAGVTIFISLRRGGTSG